MDTGTPSSALGLYSLRTLDEKLTLLDEARETRNPDIMLTCVLFLKVRADAAREQQRERTVMLTAFV